MYIRALGMKLHNKGYFNTMVGSTATDAPQGILGTYAFKNVSAIDAPKCPPVCLSQRPPRVSQLQMSHSYIWPPRVSQP